MKILYFKCDKRLKSLNSYSNYNGSFPFDISPCLFHKSLIYKKHFIYFCLLFHLSSKNAKEEENQPLLSHVFLHGELCKQLFYNG